MPHTPTKIRKKDPNLMKIVDGEEPLPASFNPDADKMTEFRENAEVKRKILDLFESLQVTTLSEAAQKVGISKYRVYKMRREDPEWAEELKIAFEITADKIEGELLDSKKLTEEKMPGVTARIFLLNGLRPNKYKNTKLTFENPKLEQLLERIDKAGKNGG